MNPGLQLQCPFTPPRNFHFPVVECIVATTTHSLKHLEPKEGLPRWHTSKEYTYQCTKYRVASTVPGLGRSPRGGNGNPLQYSCLGNPMDKGAWWATVHRVAKSWTRLKLLGICIYKYLFSEVGFPCGSDSKVSAHNAGDPGSIPGSGSSPGEGNGNPVQYYCLENPMDGGAR